MTLHPHDPYSQPSPAPQSGGGGRPSPAPQGGWEDPGPAAPEQTPGLGPAPGSDLGADLGAALRFAGQTLLRNPLTLLGAGALYSVLLIVVIVVAFMAALFLMIAVVEAGPSTGGELTAGQLLLVLAVSFGVVLVALPVGVLWQAGAARAGGAVLEGRRPSFDEALIGRGRVLVTAALAMALIMIGSILLYLPGIVASVLLMYAIPASVRGASPLAACQESFSLARSHLGTTLLGWILMMVVSYVASMTMIGMIAAIPFAVLLQIGLYERISGREVAEPARG